VTSTVGEKPLTGRTALVTGAGNGLGRAISLEFAQRGARVILVGRTASKLTGVLAEVEALGHAGRTLICDTADPAAVQELQGSIEHEQVSILVNNAGIAGPTVDLVDLDPGDWNEVFDVNVKGVYLMCKAVLPGMISRGSGDVINVASVTGKRPLVQRTPYAASKMAVIGLTITLAWEVGPLGISVNSLSPGPVDGPRMQRNFRLSAERNATTPEAAEAAFTSRAALGRMVTEREVAQAAVAMLAMPGLCGADIDLSAGMIGR
jgi:NAD(P)-dependent dehydrogenase (short-subunit alcohol dehydrogenase family)